MNLTHKIKQLESELAADIHKLVKKYEKKAKELIPIGTPVEYTVVTTSEELAETGSNVKTVESRVNGDARFLESFGHYDVVVPVDDRAFIAETLVFNTDDSEQELFNE